MRARTLIAIPLVLATLAASPRGAGAQAVSRVLSPLAGGQEAGRALVDRVATAMGGRERLLAVRTLLLHGSGDAFQLGQAATPEA